MAMAVSFFTAPFHCPPKRHAFVWSLSCPPMKPSPHLLHWHPFQTFSLLETSIRTSTRANPNLGSWVAHTPYLCRCSEDRAYQPENAIDSALPKTRKRGLFEVVGIIGLSTAAGKILGLLRETVLAAVFGVGPVVTAFSYSSILPGFFLALLGGVNGPFHVTMVAVLSKHPKEEGRLLVEKVSTVIGLVCAAVGGALFVFAGPVIDVTAPGLLLEGSTSAILTRKLAIVQLKIMAPCALLGGLIGIGFGCLSAVGVYGLPSLSSSLSSISILAAVLIYAMRLGLNAVLTPQHLMSGAVSVAVGATLGALAQWCVQFFVGHC